MTTGEVEAMVRETGLPFSYYLFTKDTAVSPPFICYYYQTSEDLYADGINYARFSQLVIELYTDKKDFALENRVESVLSGHELSYERQETYISEELMYMVVYTMEVCIDA